MEAAAKNSRRWRIIAVGCDPTIERPNERLRRKSPTEASHHGRRNSNDSRCLTVAAGVIHPSKQTQIKPNRLDERRLGEGATSDSLPLWQFGMRHQRRRRRAVRAKARDQSQFRGSERRRYSGLHSDGAQERRRNRGLVSSEAALGCPENGDRPPAAEPLREDQTSRAGRQSPFFCKSARSKPIPWLGTPTISLPDFGVLHGEGLIPGS